MNAGQFQQVRALFHEVCDLAPERRAAILDSCSDLLVRDEVEALLAADSAAQGPLGPGTEPLGERLLRRRPMATGTAAVPERIGPYRVLERIGGGGMGEVFTAQQERPRRVVAIKLVRRDLATPATERRFEFEAQVLGGLQHPYIAQIFEAGVERPLDGAVHAVGRPYLVMEYIDGRPLTRFAEDQELDLRARLALLAEVCDGVQHAHQRGVIHRDLKPANILVTPAGQPKILDFGIARSLDGSAGLTLEHGAGALLGTLPYMSPEQIAGPPDGVDVRSDVYALGVMLFELLADRLPHDLEGRSLLEAARIVGEHDAPRIGTLNRSLRGDLETIVAKALDRDPARRYQSAADLAGDLRRYLRGAPLLARADSTLYLLRKGLRRYRAALAVALAFVILAGAFAVFLALSLRRQAALLADAHAARDAETDARELAEQEGRRAQAISGFLRDMLVSVDPVNAAGHDLRLRDFLDRAAQQLDDGALGTRPEVEAALRTTLGKTYHALGLVAEAEHHLNRALTLVTSVYGENSAQTASVLNSLGAMYRRRGELDRAEEICRRVVAIVRAQRGVQHRDYAIALGELADVYRSQGKYAEAEAEIRAQIRILAALGEGPSEPTAVAQVKLGQALESQRRYAEAAEAFARGVELATQAFGRQHPWTAFALEAYGSLLAEQPDTQSEGIFLLEEALAIRRAVMPPNHPDTGNAAVNLAAALEHSDPPRAVALLEEAIQIYEAAVGEHDPRVSGALVRLAGIYADHDDFAAARPLYERAVEINRAVFGPDHPRTAGTLHNLGVTLVDQGDYAAAEPMLREALAIRRQHLPPDDRGRTVSLCTYAQVLTELGRFAEAEVLARECLAAWTRVVPSNPAAVARAQALLGNTLLGLGLLDEAEASLLEAYAALRSDENARPRRRAEVIEALARLYDARGNPAEAQRWRTLPPDTQPAPAPPDPIAPRGGGAR